MIVKDQLLDSIKPEHQKEWRLKVNEAENFFKHADRDHASTSISVRSSRNLNFRCDTSYWRLPQKNHGVRTRFGWFVPKTWIFLSMHEEHKAGSERTKHMGKTRFFEAMLPVVTDGAPEQPQRGCSSFFSIARRSW